VCHFLIKDLTQAENIHPTKQKAHPATLIHQKATQAETLTSTKKLTQAPHQQYEFRNNKYITISQKAHPSPTSTI
jgi:hypothetical protein